MASPYAPRTRRSHVIAEELRRQIHDGELKPGDKLPTEMELCKTFRVSRATLREAVQMLRGNNQLEVTPGRGSYVLAPDLTALLNDFTRLSIHKPLPTAQRQKMHELLLEEAIHNLERLSNERKKVLSDYILDLNLSIEDNTQREINWQLQIAKLTENPLLHAFLHALLALDKSRRTQILSKSQSLIETINLQNSINTAIIAGNSSLAADLFSAYLTTL